MQSRVQSWRPCANAFCDFSSPRLWSIAPATKNCCQVIRSAAPVTHIHLPKTEDLMLQNATPLGKSLPWTGAISDEHVSCIAPATRNAFLQILCKCSMPAIVFGNAAKASHFAHFLARCRIPCACHAKPHLNLQKRSGHGVLLTFWLGNVLRATTASEAGVFCTFWLGNVLCATWACNFSTSQLPPVVRRWCALYVLNVLRATTACTFLTSQPPKVVQRWCVLYILTSKRASRHNGVQFFISHLARWLHIRRFSKRTFRLSGAKNHWKNTVNRDFLTCSRTCITHLLSSHSFSSLNFSLLLFFSLTLPTSAFPSVHIFVGSLTSKLPSTRPHRHFE